MTAIAHRDVFETMGTVVSLVSPDPLPQECMGEVRSTVADLDERFSLYRAESEGSAVGRWEVPLAAASELYRGIYTEAVEWRSLTEGAFNPHRPDGVIDLSGIVKAWAMKQAGECLDRHGVDRFCLNAGGDVLTAGEDRDGPWLVGIVDPFDRSALWTSFATGTHRRAVATSGTTERGEHVWRLGSDSDFIQVTVCAEDIVTADVLATAVLSGGRRTLDLVQRHWDVDVLAATTTDRVWASPVFIAV